MTDQDSKNQIQVKFETFEVTRSPYIKADAWQVARLGRDYVLSGFQFDYQYLIGNLSNSLEVDSSKATIPVGRFVMNVEGFNRLVNQIKELEEKLKIEDKQIPQIP